MLYYINSNELEIVRPFELMFTKKDENGLEQDSKALFNQNHSIDKFARYKKYLRKADPNLLKKVDRRLKPVLALK